MENVVSMDVSKNFQMDWENWRYLLKVSNSTLTGQSAKGLDNPSTLIEETNPIPQPIPHTQSQHTSGMHNTTWIQDEADNTG